MTYDQVWSDRAQMLRPSGQAAGALGRGCRVLCAARGGFAETRASLGGSKGVPKNGGRK